MPGWPNIKLAELVCVFACGINHRLQLIDFAGNKRFVSGRVNPLVSDDYGAQ